MEGDDSAFDKVLHIVGENGKFQKQFHFIFNVGLVLCSGMGYMNTILSMTVPDHWCYVPRTDNTNYSLEQWKNITIPREYDAKGLLSYSSCFMYNDTSENDTMQNVSNSTCQYGYEYDLTWFKTTTPSTQDWVCDKNLLVTNVFAVSRMGEVFGSFAMGYIGDIYGRRMVYLVGIILTLVGRTLSIFTAHIYYVFLIANVIATFPSMLATQSVLVISMEISQPEHRARIAVFQNLGWTAGMCIMPLIYWAVGDWVIFTIATTLPLVLYLFLYRNIIESPRWLASQGNIDGCVRELKKIAKKNGTIVTDEAVAILEEGTCTKGSSSGIMSIFSSISLAKNTILLLIAWITMALAYFTIMLDTPNMEGNPFLNFIIQAVVEVPGFFAGMYSADKIGRRWTGVWSYFIATVTCGANVIVVGHQSQWLHTILMSINKFCITVGFYVATLQSMEIYPTCVRQTGMALGVLISSAFAILGPYILFLGTSMDARLPAFILMILGCVGCISEFFLPETLHVKLPENIQEARVFGKDQQYFSIPRKLDDNYNKAMKYALNKQIHSEKDSNLLK